MRASLKAGWIILSQGNKGAQRQGELFREGHTQHFMVAQVQLVDVFVDVDYQQLKTCVFGWLTFGEGGGAM
jgi:hypothetical protein